MKSYVNRKRRRSIKHHAVAGGENTASEREWRVRRARENVCQWGERYQYWWPFVTAFLSSFSGSTVDGLANYNRPLRCHTIESLNRIIRSTNTIRALRHFRKTFFSLSRCKVANESEHSRVQFDWGKPPCGLRATESRSNQRMSIWLMRRMNCQLHVSLQFVRLVEIRYGLLWQLRESIDKKRFNGTGNMQKKSLSDVYAI